MNSPERVYSLASDRIAALELLRLQEAARLANDQLESRTFQRNNKLSHVVHFFFNLGQVLTAITADTFHYLHYEITKKLRETDPTIPEVPDQGGDFFFVYSLCLTISCILGIGWLTTKLFQRIPIIPIIGNAIGIALMMTGGILAMHYAEGHINLNEVSDEQLLVHPIFVHNFFLCILSICGLIFYSIPTWILYDSRRWIKHSIERTKTDFMNDRRKKCRCKSRKDRDPTNRSDVTSLPVALDEPNEDVQNEPVVLYCCCVDFYGYLKSSKYSGSLAHEFVVIQVM